jgi:hypothetical protein
MDGWVDGWIDRYFIFSEKMASIPWCPYVSLSLDKLVEVHQLQGTMK